MELLVRLPNETELVEAEMALGDTVDEVVGYMRARGITGIPQEPCRCPVARAVASILGEDEDNIQVTGAVVEWCGWTSGGEYAAAMTYHAHCVSDFIGRFDDREFPELISKEA